MKRCANQQSTGHFRPRLYLYRSSGCGAALKALEIYQREQLFEHAAQVGAYMQSRLREYESHPLAGEVRGKGLIAAVELVANKDSESASPMARLAHSQTVLSGQRLTHQGSQRQLYRFCPPLIISREQIDEMISMFDLALGQTLDYVHKEKLLSETLTEELATLMKVRTAIFVPFILIF